MGSINKDEIEARLREDKRYYRLNKLVSWAGRIGGLAMIIGGAVAESKGYDGKMWIAGGAAVSLLGYIHPYRQIQNMLEEEIKFLQRVIERH